MFGCLIMTVKVNCLCPVVGVSERRRCAIICYAMFNMRFEKEAWVDGFNKNEIGRGSSLCDWDYSKILI